MIAWLERRFNLTEIFSLVANFGLFPSELDTTKPVREAVAEALERPWGSYARWPRVLGILSFFLFVFLGLTGVMLAFYYQPTASEAYESVTTVVRDVHFGWFVHHVHIWAARLLLVILLVRVWRFFFRGLYKEPREAFWIVSVLTVFGAFLADFTGRLLVWDSRQYWATVRAVEIIDSLPVLGGLFAYLVGGRSLDSVALIRFYFLHIVLLPAGLIILFYLNFSGVRRVGLSHAAAAERPPAPGVYARYLYNLLIMAVVVLGLLVTFATLLPTPFGHPADPFQTPAGARPPWYMLASHGFLEAVSRVLPRWAGGLIIEAFLAVAVLLPFLDRWPGRHLRDRRVAVGAGAAVLLLWVLFSWYGYNLEVKP